ncbi:MAG: hypothetical protein Q7S27_02135 [Nanoarchaeota archaeon]|nr:hypothetical protein [Nanoarchaeota archaeon]
MNTKDLILKIKEKKELQGLADSIIEEALQTYFIKHNLASKNLRPSEIKIIVKDIRSQLRNLTGRFQSSIKKRAGLLRENNIIDLLKTHSSTKERLNYYPVLKDLIKKLNVKSILDLGCGLNPIALASPKITYYASDIKEDDLKLVQYFFQKNSIKGKTFIYDIRKITSDIPKTDLCILFKVLDIADKNKYHLAKMVFENISSKYILVSFATKTLSQKAMRSPKRRWFEYLINKLDLSYDVFSSDNEIFYLIKKI